MNNQMILGVAATTAVVLSNGPAAEANPVHIPMAIQPPCSPTQPWKQLNGGGAPCFQAPSIPNNTPEPAHQITPEEKAERDNSIEIGAKAALTAMGLTATALGIGVWQKNKNQKPKKHTVGLKK